MLISWPGGSLGPPQRNGPSRGRRLGSLSSAALCVQRTRPFQGGPPKVRSTQEWLNRICSRRDGWYDPSWRFIAPLSPPSPRLVGESRGGAFFVSVGLFWICEWAASTPTA